MRTHLKVLLALFVVVYLLPEASYGQGFIEVTDRGHVERIRPPRPVPDWALDLIKSDVQVRLDDGVAQVSVNATFRNPYERQVEGTYYFPVPEDAQVDNFKAQLGDQVLTGEILTREEASRIYESLVRRVVDPAILEYYGQGLFRARIFPVPAHTNIQVSLSYKQVLRRSGGIYRWVYPLATSSVGARSIGQDLSVVVDLTTREKLRSVYSPSHPHVQIRKNARSGRVELRGTPRTLSSRDFVLEYLTAQDGLAGGVRTFRESGEDGYFFLRLAPGTEPLGERTATHLVMVVDTSGSMASFDKIGKAQDALQNAIGRLGPEDTFQIIAFSGQVRSLFEEPQFATQEAKKSATSFIKGLVARGATDIDSALRRAMADVRSHDAGTLVLISDGAPTMGLTDPRAIVQGLVDQNRNDFRVHVFGVGQDVNTVLLDDLARKNGGSRTYVRGNQNLEVQVSSLLDKVLLPCLAGVQIEGKGVRIHSMVPGGTQDLFFGEDLVIAGRYEVPDNADAAIRVRGRAGAIEKSYEFRASFPSHGGQTEAATLWAQLRVFDLLDLLRSAPRDQRSAIQKEIVDLGLRFGIVTPYTSYLVREAGDREIARDARRRLGRLSEGARGLIVEDEEAMDEATGASSFGYAKRQAKRKKKAGKAAEPLAKEEKEIVEAFEIIQSAGRTFHLHGKMRVDGAFNEGMLPEPDQTLVFASEAYMKFLSDNPEAAAILAVSRNLLFLWKGKVVKVEEQVPREPAGQD